MDKWDALKERIDSDVRDIVDSANKTQERLLDEIEAAKRDEILDLLRNLDARLSSVERKLTSDDPLETDD